MFHVVLVGPPCSGKTTLGDELARVTKLPHVVSSKIIAEAAADAKLLDHSLQLAHVVSRLRCPDCANGFILDNFPRTADQARDLQHALNCDKGSGVTHVLDLEVPPSELERRAALRLVDPTKGPLVLCADSQAESVRDDAIVDGQVVMHGEMQSANCMPDGQLVMLGGMQSAEGMPVRRADDAPDRVYQKLQRYAENIAGIRGFYEPEALCKTIDGSQARKEVLSQALELLGIDRDGRAATTTIEEVPQRYAKARAHLATVEDRNSRLSTHSLPDMQRKIGNDDNWKESTECPQGDSCVCKVETRRYVGADPGKLLRECQQSAQEVSQIQQCLWQARKEYHKDRHGGKRWYRCAIPSLFAACAKATQEIEELQQRCKDADREVQRLRDKCTEVCADSATQSVATYCDEHQPDHNRS